MLIRTSSRALSFGARVCCSAFAHSAQVHSLNSCSAAQTVALRVDFRTCCVLLWWELNCGGWWVLWYGVWCIVACIRVMYECSQMCK